MTSYRLYQALPVFLQNLACTLYGYKESRLRFSKDFFSIFSNLKKSDFYCAEVIHSYKTDQLSEILLSAKLSGLHQSLTSFSESDILSDPWSVLKALPVAYKDDVRNSFNKVRVDRSLYPVITSGTTGKALSFYKDKQSVSGQWAVWFRHRYRFGVGFKDVSVNFTGKPVVPAGQKRPPFWRYNAAQKQYLVSMQHINLDNIASIVGFLNSVRPRFYSGYPSILAEVSRLAKAKGLELHSDSVPEIIFTGAEKLLDYQKDSIEAWSGSRVTDQYGLSEGCCNFSKCEYGHYHEDYEFCHIEILDGEVLEDGSIKGRLVGTGFYNHAMPFLRYDTGDIAIMAPEDFQCQCGRQSRVIFSVDGRADDFVLTPDGRRVMRFDYLFKDTEEALEAQVVQEEKGSITIRAVLSGFGDKASFEKKVKAHFDEYVAASMELVFEYVDSIERTSTGKFKAVVNRLDI